MPIIFGPNNKYQDDDFPIIDSSTITRYFLKLACSELTYNEIADKMCVGPRTVDGYREVVFQKMNVRMRVGMVVEAIRHGLVEI